MSDVASKKIAVLVDDYFEEAEFTGPIKAFKDAGVAVDVVATEAGELHSMNHAELSDTYQADLSLEDADMVAYDALVLPGGGINADSLRMEEKAQEWVKKFMDESKPVAAICHAPWLLASAGVVKGRKLTSYETIQDDLRNAGADWVDEEVVIDSNLITSRKPDDIPAFNEAIITMLQNG